MKNFGFLLIVLPVLFSCNDTSHKSAIREYYPIDSLVEAQINYFVANNAKLVKNNTDSMLAKKGQLLDSSNWAQELEIFHSLNINKPTFIDAYKKDIYNDDKSNLKILNYSAIDDKMSVQDINIYYLKSLDDIKQITATINYANTLYNSSKKLQMKFIKRDDLTVIKSYHIIGDQKMTMRDSIEVSIFSKILF